MILNDEMERLL